MGAFATNPDTPFAPALYGETVALI
jgi:hypothetical protein